VIGCLDAPTRCVGLSSLKLGAHKMKYSISYKDAAGITLRSEYLAFANDEDASTFATKEKSRNALIEVWKGEQLLVRYEQAARSVRA